MGIWVEGEDACEVHGTRRETFTRHSFEAEVTLEVPYAKKDVIIGKLFEQLYDNDYPLTKQAIASPPYLNTQAFVTSIVVVPFYEKGNPTVGAEKWDYPFVRLRVKYSTNTSDNQQELLEVSVESQVQDHTKFLWKSDKKQVTKDEAPVRQIRSAIYTVIDHNTPFLSEQYQTLMGTVNDKKYVPRNIGTTFEFAPETMLYVPGDVKETVYLTDDGANNAVFVKSPTPTYKWLVKLDEGATWNKFYDPTEDITGASKGYKSLSKKDDPSWKLYPTADHGPILPGNYGP